MSLFGKEPPKSEAHVESSVPFEFDPRALQSIIKQGGKKKLDTLLEMFRVEAPKRVDEIERASSPAEACASAKVLKSSAANLGLMGLEDVCDQILAQGTKFSTQSELAKLPRPFLQRAQNYLERGRKAI